MNSILDATHQLRIWFTAVVETAATWGDGTTPIAEVYTVAEGVIPRAGPFAAYNNPQRQVATAIRAVGGTLQEQLAGCILAADCHIEGHPGESARWSLLWALRSLDRPHWRNPRDVSTGQTRHHNQRRDR